MQVKTGTPNTTMINNLATASHDIDELHQPDNTSIAMNQVSPGGAGQPLAAQPSSVTTEGCMPANMVIDPGEMVTVNICVANTTGVAETVIGTMRATGGVTNPSGPQTYTNVQANPVCQTFNFTSDSNQACGAIVNVAVDFATTGGASRGTMFYQFTQGVRSPPSSPTFQCCSSGPVTPTLIISEFRVRGPGGANDEFIELANVSGADHTVAGGGTGYAIVASDAALRCVVPNGTVVPNGGHYLCTNSVAYSLSNYGGTGAAAGDATYTTDIPDNAGIALFNTTVAADFTLANRLDAVGSTSEANTLYKEGTGYPALTPFSIDYSFYRDLCGKQGSITTFGLCPSPGAVADTDNNAVDFIFVDTNGTSAGAGQRLGAPGPENLASPIGLATPIVGVALLDATVARSLARNRVRSFASDPANNSTFGTYLIRRVFTNNTGVELTRLRFRVIDQTTFPAPSGTDDLRTRTSSSEVVAGINDAATCAAVGVPATPPCSVTVQGTTLEQPPSQPNGGAFNGSWSDGTITLGTPLAPGASTALQFLLGIQQRCRQVSCRRFDRGASRWGGHFQGLHRLPPRMSPSRKPIPPTQSWPALI